MKRPVKLHTTDISISEFYIILRNAIGVGKPYDHFSGKLVNLMRLEIRRHVLEFRLESLWYDTKGSTMPTAYSL